MGDMFSLNTMIDNH